MVQCSYTYWGYSCLGVRSDHGAASANASPLLTPPPPPSHDAVVSLKAGATAMAQLSTQLGKSEVHRSVLLRKIDERDIDLAALRLPFVLSFWLPHFFAFEVVTLTRTAFANL